MSCFQLQGLQPGKHLQQAELKASSPTLSAQGLLWLQHGSLTATEWTKKGMVSFLSPGMMGR